MKDEEEKEKIFCKKIRYSRNNPGQELKPSILLGLIESEDNNFIFFRTARKLHRISKSCVISVEDTNEEFRKGVQ